MPIDDLQERMAKLLKANRSKASFVGGSSPFNVTFPRRSEDMDIYTHGSVGDIAANDVKTLQEAGMNLDVNDQFYGFTVEATVAYQGAVTKIEWNEADRERFFPVKSDDTFGWTIHRTDLAVQKLVAAASRRKARDPVDVALIDILFAPIAALAIAAPAKFANVAPTAVLDRILRNAMEHPQRDYEALDLDRSSMPFDIKDVKIVLADRIAAAQRTIVDQCPTAEPGCLYVWRDTGKLGLPTAKNMRDLKVVRISEFGSIPEIGNQKVLAKTWKIKDPYERP